MDIRKVLSGSAIAIAIILMVPATVVARPKFTVTEIPSATAPAECEGAYQYNVYARRMNDKGQAVGHIWCYVDTGDAGAPFLARGLPFAWSAPTGSFALEIPPGETSEVLARDINKSGVIVGRRNTSPYGPPYGLFTWTFAGGLAELSDGSSCNPAMLSEGGINDDGSIAYRTYRSDAQGRCRPMLVLRRASGEEVAGPWNMRGYALNNAEVAVGIAGSAAVKWSPALGMVILSDGEPDKIKAGWNLNQGGDVVGYAEAYSPDYVSIEASDAILWPADGGEVLLPKLSGYPVAYATDINDERSIVGYSAPVGGADADRTRATLWSAGKTWDLNDLIPRDSGIQLVRASSINRAGQILVSGVRLDEPKKPCPQWDYDPLTGEYHYNASYMCRDEYAFILTPKVDR